VSYPSGSLSNQESRKLVRHGKQLGARIKDLISIVSYSTFRKWFRQMEDGAAAAKPAQGNPAAPAPRINVPGVIPQDVIARGVTEIVERDPVVIAFAVARQGRGGNLFGLDQTQVELDPRIDPGIVDQQRERLPVADPRYPLPTQSRTGLTRKPEKFS